MPFLVLALLLVSAPTFAADRKIEKELTDALSVYLNRCTTDGKAGNEIPWKIKLQLTPQQIKAIADGEKITGMYGGKNPLVGTQEFQAELQKINPATGRKTLVRFTAEIDLPPKVVVARRALQKGKLLNENDIRVEYQDNLKGTDYFSQPHEVLGKAAASNVPEGAVLTSRSVQKPILVKKGEVVTVVAKNAGVTVTSTGKALEDGTEGDLIMVDQLLKPTPEKGRSAITQKTDSTFAAKVASIGTVEVFATGNRY
ncbi:MAG: flagellar basal body P-ring formation chaperone FlgA [Planctomycetaceae bacterium]|nr:flagellar basal body P-ring formation chaperone FlgA [Planctomycetaceae bacterium]